MHDFRKEISAYAQAVIEPFATECASATRAGRSIVGAAGVLLTRVIYRKTTTQA